MGNLSRLQLQSLHIALIVLVGVTVYSNTLHVPFVLDDTQTLYSLSNMNLGEILMHGSYRRVADASFFLNYWLHGSSVTGYHLINLAIHLATAITLLFVMKSVSHALRASFLPSGNVTQDTTLLEHFVPLASALLFVSHPLQTQAVTYIIQRYTSLSTFFYLLSVLMFLKGRMAYEKKEKRGFFWLVTGLSLVAGLLAMGCKQTAFTLPAVLILFEIFLFRGRLLTRRFYYVVSGVCVLVMAVTLVVWWGRAFDEFLAALQMATAETDLITRKTYFLTQTRVVATYLRLLLMPFGQSLIWDSPLYTSLFSIPVLGFVALHSAILSTAAVFFRRSSRNLLTDDWQQGVLQRIVALGIAWFYVTMSVESSVIPILAVMFEHRVYLPSVGFFMTVTAAASLAIRLNNAQVKTAWVLLAVLCLVTGGLTLARNHKWHDPLVLSEAAHNKFPHNPLAKIYLSHEYMSRKMPDKALPLIVSVITEHPGLVPYAKVYLGKILLDLGVDQSRFSTGEEFVRPGGGKELVEMDETDWKKWDGLICNNLGLAYEYLGEPISALRLYFVALDKNPAYDLAWYNLGILSHRLGIAKEAGNSLIQLERLNPALARKLKSDLRQ